MIAVAESYSKLNKLLTYHGRGSFDPNISSMVLIGMPNTSRKNPGQKTGAKRKRPNKNRLFLR